MINFRITRLIPRIYRSMSTDRKSELVSNFNTIKDKITKKEVLLVAVSKLKPASDIQLLYDATGHRHYGENYVQELIEKASSLPKDIQWHFIGGLQSNKCKQLASSVENLVVETLDTEKKANELSKGRSTPLSVFIQVNTSGEDSKSGIAPEEAINLAKHVLTCENLDLKGVMTIGAIAASKDHASENEDFKKLKEVRDALQKELGVQLKLSMGMSEDFEDAVTAGSDQVRVGSAIFGARPQPASKEAKSSVAEESG